MRVRFCILHSSCFKSWIGPVYMELLKLGGGQCCQQLCLWELHHWGYAWAPGMMWSERAVKPGLLGWRACTGPLGKRSVGGTVGRAEGSGRVWPMPGEGLRHGDGSVAPVAAPPPFLPPLPSLRGSSTQLSPASISVTTLLWG